MPDNKYKTVPLRDYVSRTSELYDPNFGEFFPQDKWQELEKRNIEFRSKYGEFAANREYWGDLYNQQIPIEGKRLGDVILNVSSATGVDPRLLLGNAMEEGFFKSVHNKKQVLNSRGTPDPNYPINGMVLLGLDTFGDRINTLKNYLPKDFSYILQKGRNNKDEVTTGLFKNTSDALVALSAEIKANRNYIDNYARTSGVKLSPAATDFFTMAAYNAGEGNAKKMIEYYANKGLLKEDKFLKMDELAKDKYGGVYENVRRRIDPVSALEKEGKFDFSDKRKEEAKRDPWTKKFTGVSKKEGNVNVIVPDSKDIPFKVVITSSGKKVAPRDANLSNVDVNKLPDLDIYNYEANLKK